ncbi:DinB family protein [Methylovulum psychrotolerans]|uniref:DinB family protein n=1 Tax=Methylovulum psychrotolerans TaxID=1704499 RepID=UPI001BFF4470|nr:DinB family protein [Methylovulum psychrotolerans]MBT9099508.1 DinB family protein [Methylovulum psychrotolerans]
MGCTQHIRLMAEYNAWMNIKVFTAALTLPEAERVADKKAFFGSIIGTLNHLLVADTLWLKRFAGHPALYTALGPVARLPTPTALNQQLFTDLQGLYEHRQWLDTVIVEWAEAITEPDLTHILHYVSTKGVPGDKDFFSLIMHFFNHQTHHRGQATTLLCQAGVDVGVTDLVALIPNAL